jgi:hypothetical protein
VPDPANPQDFNRYAYVRNNPLLYIDPSGHKVIDAPTGASVWPPPPPPQTPEVWPENPFWDRERGAVRHLVQSCDWTECSAAAFNAYVPGGWNFQLADEWHAATSEVYKVGPISEAEALQAAREGRPNPVEDEQYSEGLLRRPNRSFLAEDYQMLNQGMWLPYHYLFQELDWTTVDMKKMSNFEPRYLETLIANHPREVDDAYQRAIREYEKDPEWFMLKMDALKLFGGGRK